ncbi:Bug family tripartite tricarboxylate transporter substrate binding protein [Ramlibacter sp.]|uniref:Bug family tripartite tricarboxylate transporter substrate binding protein n=1 Tax=Ramlibacter sp. TaxID=1917967 RepID=UPI003D10314E
MLRILKTFLHAGFAASLAVLSLQAAAQAYPSRPVTLVIPWQAGGIPDTQLRLLARLAAPHLGQPIVVENKPGGVGTMAPAAVAANSKPDGYTITQLTTAVLRMPHMMKVSYDFKKDFTYIGGLSAFRFGVVVRNDSPLKTWQDFVAYAKANPGQLTYTTFGTNSVLHLTMERIAAATGIKLRHVPSRGNAENNAAVLGGHVMASADGSAWAPFVDSGQFRLLVTWGDKRSKRWPNVPTLKEVGIDIVESTPFGLIGPAGMDPAVVDKIYGAFRKAMHEPEHMKLMAQYDMDLFELGPADFRKWAFEEEVRIGEVVRRFAEKDTK